MLHWLLYIFATMHKYVQFSPNVRVRVMPRHAGDLNVVSCQFYAVGQNDTFWSSAVDMKGGPKGKLALETCGWAWIVCRAGRAKGKAAACQRSDRGLRPVLCCGARQSHFEKLRSNMHS